MTIMLCNTILFYADNRYLCKILIWKLINVSPRNYNICVQSMSECWGILNNYYGDKINNTIEASSTACTYYILFCADVVQIRKKFIMSSRRTKRHKEKQSAKLPIKLNHIRKRNFTMYTFIDMHARSLCRRKKRLIV